MFISEQQMLRVLFSILGTGEYGFDLPGLCDNHWAVVSLPGQTLQLGGQENGVGLWLCWLQRHWAYLLGLLTRPNLRITPAPCSHVSLATVNRSPSWSSMSLSTSSGLLACGPFENLLHSYVYGGLSYIQIHFLQFELPVVKCSLNMRACSVVSTLCDPMDCSPPGSSVHGVLQARVLEWVAMLSPRESSSPGEWVSLTRRIEPASSVSPALQADRFFTHGAAWKTLVWMHSLEVPRNKPWVLDCVPSFSVAWCNLISWLVLSCSRTIALSRPSHSLVA